MTADEIRSELTAIGVEIAALPLRDRCDHENDAVADGEGYLGCVECGLRRRARELRGMLAAPVVDLGGIEEED